MGYGKSRLTFADKNPGQGKRKAATPEKLKYLSPLKGGLKPGSTIGYRSTRIVPISEKSGGFYPAGFTERLYPEIAYLNRVSGCIHALGIAVESPQPLGEDLERKARPSHGNAQKKKNPPNIHPGDIQAVTSIIIQIKIIRTYLLPVPENKALFLDLLSVFVNGHYPLHRLVHNAVLSVHDTTGNGKLDRLSRRA